MDIVYILLGIVIGVGLSMIFVKTMTVGFLRIDKSDPADIPYLFLEVTKSINTISDKRYVVLKVKRKNFISHE